MSMYEDAIGIALTDHRLVNNSSHSSHRQDDTGKRIVSKVTELVDNAVTSIDPLGEMRKLASELYVNRWRVLESLAHGERERPGEVLAREVHSHL